MTIAAFVHPFVSTQSVLVCRSTHLSPALQVKLARLAAQDQYQIVLVGPCPPEVQAAVGPAVPGFTPEARSAATVTVPGTRHALAHVRATTRHVFLIDAASDAITACAAALTRAARWTPGQPSTDLTRHLPANIHATAPVDRATPARSALVYPGASFSGLPA